jgi:hypothetical protein
MRCHQELVQLRNIEERAHKSSRAETIGSRVSADAFSNADKFTQSAQA